MQISMNYATNDTLLSGTVDASQKYCLTQTMGKAITDRLEPCLPLKGDTAAQKGR